MILRGIIIAITLICLNIETVCETRYIRKNVNALSHKEWEDLKNGIKVMKERNFKNKYDPLGYYFQANIHGWPEYDGSEQANRIADRLNWHKCQHNAYFFLIWHRMYIYFFERILQKSANNPNLGLPYWDYFEPNTRSLPQPFRLPADNRTNPLFVSQRCDNVNEGKPIPEKVTNPYPALNTNFFTTYKQNNELNLCHSFGGGRTDTPAFESNREGLLERIPHDNIHLYVGGIGGYMSDLCKSSRDPIFFVHHSQVDRIWNSWIHAGGKDITDPKFLNQTFDFYNETGQLNRYKVGDFLNITKLGYNYDYLIKSDPVDLTLNENPKFYIPIDEKENLNINYYKRYITLDLRTPWIDFFEKLARGEFDVFDIKFSIQFDIEYLEPDVFLEIYMNLNDKTYPTDSLPNFIGSIVTFTAHCVPSLKRRRLTIQKCYDITKELRGILSNDYNFNGAIPNEFNLTFVPKFCDNVHYPLSSDDLVRFNEILLVFHREDESVGYTSQPESFYSSQVFNKSQQLWESILSNIDSVTPRPNIGTTFNIDHN